MIGSQTLAKVGMESSLALQGLARLICNWLGSVPEASRAVITFRRRSDVNAYRFAYSASIIPSLQRPDLDLSTLVAISMRD